MIKTPYLLFLGDAPDQLSAKVAQGITDWRPNHVLGQIKLPGCQADVGVKNLTLEDAKTLGAKTLVIGVANRGGKISENWKKTLLNALKLKMDIASGLHNLLSEDDQLLKEAKINSCQLHDVRITSTKFPIANGIKRQGKRCLTIGTDCSVGKMYTAISIEKEMKTRGIKSTFRATGQTGILITGAGIPLDAIIADFMAGAVEQLTPDNDLNHWDIIEGQGSLAHISYSGVTMALMHGGQPDKVILCHEPTRKHMRGLPGYTVPTLTELKTLSLPIAQRSNNKCEISGISINTQNLSDSDTRSLLTNIEAEMGLPTVDPFKEGSARLVDSLLK